MCMKYRIKLRRKKNLKISSTTHCHGPHNLILSLILYSESTTLLIPCRLANLTVTAVGQIQRCLFTTRVENILQGVYVNFHQSARRDDFALFPLAFTSPVPWSMLSIPCSEFQHCGGYDTNAFYSIYHQQHARRTKASRLIAHREFN